MEKKRNQLDSFQNKREILVVAIDKDKENNYKKKKWGDISVIMLNYSKIFYNILTRLVILFY